MGDVVSLKPLRKVKARALKEAQASANRARFGRTKFDKDSARAQSEKAARDLDNHARAHARAHPSTTEGRDT